jgi:hypothetical protein
MANLEMIESNKDNLTRVEMAYRVGLWRAVIQVQRIHYRKYMSELNDKTAFELVERLAEKHNWN